MPGTPSSSSQPKTKKKSKTKSKTKNKNRNKKSRPIPKKKKKKKGPQGGSKSGRSPRVPPSFLASQSDSVPLSKTESGTPGRGRRIDAH
jgi:hypothetical protein